MDDQHTADTCETWVQTHSGIAFDLESPTVAMVEARDIAISLCRLNRFLGHTKTPCSVAEHSVRVMHSALRQGDAFLKGETRRKFAIAALLHDAHEAYMGDIIRPVASLPGFVAPVRILKGRIQRVIHLRFGLPEVLPDAWAGYIRAADMIELAREKRDLMGPESRSWGALPEPNGVRAGKYPVGPEDFLRTLFALLYPGVEYPEAAARSLPPTFVCADGAAVADGGDIANWSALVSGTGLTEFAR